MKDMKVKLTIAFVVILFAMALLFNVVDNEIDMKYYTLPKNSSFKHILQDKVEYEDCSPTITEHKYLGLAINTPTTLSVDAMESELFLCSVYSYSVDDVQNRNNSYSDTIIFIVLDLDTFILRGIQYPRRVGSESVMSIDQLIPGFVDEEDNDEPVDGPTGTRITGWVNIDLHKTLNLPKKPQSLIAFATADSYVSNVREINIYDKADESKKLINLGEYNASNKINYDLVKNTSNDYFLQGTFVIDEKDKELHLDEVMHKALNIVVSSGDDYRIIRPFKDIVLFEDDIKKSGDTLVGSFNINLSKGMKNLPGSMFNVLMTFGPYVSNVTTFTVEH